MAGANPDRIKTSPVVGGERVAGHRYASCGGAFPNGGDHIGFVGGQQPANNNVSEPSLVDASSWRRVALAGLRRRAGLVMNEQPSISAPYEDIGGD